MKRVILLFGLVLGASSISSAQYGQSGAGVSFNIFYTSLGSYGEWIDLGTDVYGWRPAHVAAGWRPYVEGRWAWTNDGWYWVSNEPWGWAAYHYGRWYYDDYYGWIWIPGYEWAPAWVEWRYGPDYCGWAPLSPYAVFSINIGIRYSRHWVTPTNYWCFVDYGHINSPSVHKYVYRAENNTRYIGRTRYAGNVRSEGGRIVTRGPSRDYVEQRSRTRIEQVDIADRADVGPTRVVRGGRGERIEAYRPRVEQRSAEVERPARVQQPTRKIDIDTRRTDVRARAEAINDGRDMRRAEEYRSRGNNARQARPDVQTQREPRRAEPQQQGRVEQPSQQQRPDNRAHERPQSTAPRNDGRTYQRPQRESRPDRSVEPRSNDRPQRQEGADKPTFRSPNPERTVKRPEARQPQRVPDRGGRADTPQRGKRKE